MYPLPPVFSSKGTANAKKFSTAHTGRSAPEMTSVARLSKPELGPHTTRLAERIKRRSPTESLPASYRKDTASGTTKSTSAVHASILKHTHASHNWKSTTRTGHCSPYWALITLAVCTVVIIATMGSVGSSTHHHGRESQTPRDDSHRVTGSMGSWRVTVYKRRWKHT